MTETAQCADYVLPAPTQYEKYECTFFNLEFPANVFQLRAPVLPAAGGPLGEPEIHRRLVRALGALTRRRPRRAPRGRPGGPRQSYATAFAARLGERPHLIGLAAVVLYETLGPTLPDGARRPPRSGARRRCARSTYRESVRERRLRRGRPRARERALRGGAARAPRVRLHQSTITRSTGSGSARARPSGRLDLAIQELLEELRDLQDETAAGDPDFPFVLSAGERRSVHRDDADARSRVAQARSRTAPCGSAPPMRRISASRMATVRQIDDRGGDAAQRPLRSPT